MWLLNLVYTVPKPNTIFISSSGTFTLGVGTRIVGERERVWWSTHWVPLQWLQQQRTGRHHMKLNIRPHTTSHFITHKQQTRKQKHKTVAIALQANTPCNFYHVSAQENKCLGLL